MKKIFSLLFLFCGLTVSAAFAQSDSLLTRHEIGMDFMPLFRQDAVLYRPASLLYRKYLHNGAFRMRFQAGYRQNAIEGTEEQFFREGSGTVRVGKEWHLAFEKMRFYYGLDLRAGFFYNHSSRQQPVWQAQTSHALEAGILPLLGFQYTINRHFGLAAEANSALTGSRIWDETEGMYEIGGNFQRDAIGFQLIDEFALFLTYRF